MSFTTSNGSDDEEQSQDDTDGTDTGHTAAMPTVDLPQRDDPVPLADAVEFLGQYVEAVGETVEEMNDPDGELELTVSEHDDRLSVLRDGLQEVEGRLSDVEERTDALAVLTDLTATDVECPDCGGDVEEDRPVWGDSGVKCTDCEYVLAKVE